MIGVLTDLADKPNLGIALQRLAGLDENHARWWQAYSTAMHADRLAERISGLRWCIESAHLLDDHAEFYRKMCAGKLAFFENRAVPLNDRDSDAFQGAVTTYDVMSNGPTKDAAKQLDKILERIEQIRKYARSQTLQRELSDTPGDISCGCVVRRSAAQSRRCGRRHRTRQQSRAAGPDGDAPAMAAVAPPDMGRLPLGGTPEALRPLHLSVHRSESSAAHEVVR